LPGHFDKPLESARPASRGSDIATPPRLCMGNPATANRRDTSPWRTGRPQLRTWPGRRTGSGHHDQFQGWDLYMADDPAGTSKAWQLLWLALSNSPLTCSQDAYQDVRAGYPAATVGAWTIRTCFIRLGRRGARQARRSTFRRRSYGVPGRGPGLSAVRR